MTKDEALKLALEALDCRAFGKELERVVLTIREVLEQPCAHKWKNISSKRQTVYQCETCGIYTFEQPARSWLGLTEDDIEYPYPPAKPPVYATAMNTKAVRDGFELGGYEKEAGYYSEAQLDEFARTIEAKLKEKNT